MTTEREMLEFAAKAVGVDVRWIDTWNGFFIHVPHKLPSEWPKWNPLTNSADCAAMCAKLKIETLWADLGHFVECANNWYHQALFEDHNNDREAAWRYAATMVAAKIGGMK